MDSIAASQVLQRELLRLLRKAQRDAHKDGRLLERAQWIDAIKKAAPESFKKILLQRDIVVKYSSASNCEANAASGGNKMKNPVCGHDMVIGTDSLYQNNPGRQFAFCPQDGCAQWKVEYLVLDCAGCGRVFILNEMYSPDACSEQCQRDIEATRAEEKRD